jgi:hypothetical protein
MKNLLLTWLTACSFLSALPAQNADFAPVGAKWYYSEYHDVPPSIIPHIMECTAKELFLGKLCSKLVSSSVGPLSSPVYIYTQNDTVFFYSVTTAQFEMLYDFSADVGDSWVVGGIMAADGEGNHIFADTVTVDSMSKIFISGEELKVWHISHSIYYDWGSRIFEKAGNDMIFAPKFGFGELPIFGLRCFETPDMTWHFVPYPCDTSYSTISETVNLKDLSDIVVSPNPFSESLNITWASSPGTCSFAMVDQSGKLVFFRQNLGSALDLYTHNLPLGTYYWNVKSGNRIMQAGKCVKD